jgi:hypothetical protein
MSKNKKAVEIKEEKPVEKEAEDILAPEKKFIGYNPVTGEEIYE